MSNFFFECDVELEFLIGISIVPKLLQVFGFVRIVFCWFFLAYSLLKFCWFKCFNYACVTVSVEFFLFLLWLLLWICDLFQLWPIWFSCLFLTVLLWLLWFLSDIFVPCFGKICNFVACSFRTLCEDLSCDIFEISSFSEQIKFYGTLMLYKFVSIYVVSPCSANIQKP